MAYRIQRVRKQPASARCRRPEALQRKPSHRHAAEPNHRAARREPACDARDCCHEHVEKPAAPRRRRRGACRVLPLRRLKQQLIRGPHGLVRLQVGAARRVPN
eukprot:7335729-Prymnesium_polylepis.1